jgi:flagellar biosynthesis anti-sigma factor FlgM
MMVDPVSLNAVKPVDSRSAHRALQISTTARASGIAPARSAPLPKLLTLVSELEAQTAPVDHAKIAQIRQAIALGHYNPDPVQIAEAIMRFGGKATP